MVLSVANVAKEQEAFIREKLQIIARELHPSVTEDEEIVRRALFAVRNQAVVFHRYISVFSILTTTVRDVRAAEVIIDFRGNTISCSCPQEGWCRHQVSVLLSLYQYIDSVQEWVSSWRSKKTVDLQALANIRTPESWLKMVDEVLSHYFHGDEEIPAFMYTNIAENALEKLNKQMPFEREWQPIYKLFMELAVVNRLSLRFTKSRSVDEHLLENFFHKRFQSIQNIVHEIPGTSRLFATDPFFDQMQFLLRELLFEQEGFINRKMNLYLLFWDEVFTEKRRALEELVYLQEQREMPVPEVLNVFYIILKNDSAIEENIQHINPEHVDIHLGLVKFAYAKQNGRAAELILRAILPHLEAFIQRVKNVYRSSVVSSIYSLYEHIDLSEDEEILLYSSFGKDGIHQYSQYLLKHKRYGEWVALQQMYPSSIEHLEYNGLKQVAEEAPALVLPLYHFYAMGEIKEKSRYNYKQAVRIWKKMKAAAKKAGKMNFWEDYIASVRDQYKRLRALQEELEKGKLLG
ncbi:MAG: SWIM zinc finger family protein [Bacilli bacterium]